MPLVHFFETSFRTHLQPPHSAAHRSLRGSQRLGRMRCRRRSVLQQRMDRDCLAHDYALSCARRCWDAASNRRAIARLCSPECAGIAWRKRPWKMRCGTRKRNRKSMPLWKLLGGTRTEIPCGVSIGIQDSVEQLLDKIQIELAAGYRRIKVKVKPGLGRECAGTDSFALGRYHAELRRQFRVHARSGRTLCARSISSTC